MSAALEPTRVAVRAPSLLALAVLLLAAASPPIAADQRIDLARSLWTRNGVVPDVAPGVTPDVAPAITPSSTPDSATAAADRALVTLPCGKSVRWATTFDTGRGRMARLTLDWSGAPDGLLFEVVIDGQRLLPSRDAWRPTPRDLSSDLGSLWLGPGGHLFEIVAREKPMAPSAVRLSALELEWLGD